MSRIRGKDTKPEIAVRKLVHRMGYRFRLHRRDLPGSPDLAFPGRKKVIFVHGCFWHMHPDPGCRRARVPKSRVDYWKPKLERNRGRDLENEEKLRRLGWEVLVVWECEIRHAGRLEDGIREFLEGAAGG